MGLDDLRFCAKYPFTNEAKQLLEAEGLRLDKLPGSVLDSSASRVKNASSRAFDSELKQFESLKNEKSFVDAVASFPVAKLLAARAGRGVQKALADFEAERASFFLQRDKDDSRVLQRVAAPFFKFALAQSFSVPLGDFLRFSSQGVKLVDFVVSNGCVATDADTVCSLVKEAVRQNVLGARCDASVLPAAMKSAADSLKQEVVAVQEIDLGAVDAECFPACVLKIISDLKADEPVPHMARFVLATFCAGVKMPVDQAVLLFKGRADFDERKTKYYLEHAHGTRTGRKYSVPTCDKLASYNLKQQGCDCSHRSPLGHYKAKKLAKRHQK